MGMGKFSVITPSFQQGRYIRQTINSVLQQNYPNFEHLVIDGGSTDDTVDVLREYPHLVWISEKDRGQSHALNKGFARVTGDYVAWLCSDDWYAPQVFQEVAPLLDQYPVVLGACQIVRENEEGSYQVANVERTWFDMIKYWNPYSIPAQPSIFVRRDALEEVLLPGGELVDEELHYVMDYDLWLRLAERYPFCVRTSRVLSYYRMTDTNKTSDKVDGMPYAEPEMARVHRRAIGRRFPSGPLFSVVIPLSDWKESRSYLSQLGSIPHEILVLGSPSSRAEEKGMRAEIADFNHLRLSGKTDLYAYFFPLEEDSQIKFLHTVLHRASGEILLFPAGPDELRQDPLSWFKDMFSQLRTGMFLSTPALPSQPTAEDLFAFAGPYPTLAIRRVALLDIMTEEPPPDSTLLFHWLSLRAISKGWTIQASTQGASSPTNWRGVVEVLSPKSLATLLTILHHPPQEDPFAHVRAAFHCGLPIDEGTLEKCRELLNTPQ